MAIRRVEEKAENFSGLVTALLDVLVLYDYYVPSRTIWKLKNIGDYLGTVAAWGIANSFWTIEINGVLQPGGAIADQIGYAAQAAPISAIVAYPGDHVQVIGHNLTAADLQMGVKLEWNLEFVG
jgi:hypothetical protein